MSELFAQTIHRRRALVSLDLHRRSNRGRHTIHTINNTRTALTAIPTIAPVSSAEDVAGAGFEADEGSMGEDDAMYSSILVGTDEPET